MLIHNLLLTIALPFGDSYTVKALFWILQRLLSQFQNRNN
jgi:hypothetical protein